MPPTLNANIYGMNFDFMPELQLAARLPLALLAMIVAGGDQPLFGISRRPAGL
jgi:magnesium transporter